MWAIHQRLCFAPDKNRKAGRLVGWQEPQAPPARPGAAWLKVNLVQDVSLRGPLATTQGTKGPQAGPFHMHLAPVC